ncbi:WD40 repeat-like protein [Mycena indigotica]|uniref:WD40 repeat-like protein n=1 Tax=Mycena indigotica TaxID=2126181 RepID=A0A8H6W9W5_9AGAR|nr:WD40 repeat-like protein [Mycena indigotica]KAF7307053.1 WD40 repeat-like protein [Mycena indigotica]
MAATNVRRQKPQSRPVAPEKQTKSKKAQGKAKERHTSQHLPSEPSPESSWHWTALTDSVVSNAPPIFTNDGSYFFSLAGDSVRIYTAVTGKVASTLTIPSNLSTGVSVNITCAVLNPHNAFQLITGSDHGILAVWDFLEARLVQIIDIGQPIHYICAHQNFKDTVFVSAGGLSKGAKEGGHAVVLSVSLKPANAASQSTTQKSSNITHVGRTRQPTGLAFSPSGNWLVATAGHKAYVASTTALRAGFTKYVSPERLTCLAFHPSDDYFATGDEKGNIRLWYCLSDQIAAKPFGVEKKTQTTSLHWHAHAVSSIAFTTNGAYLLSGGEESVLVIWQLHSGKREYVPRLGSPIKTISVVKSATREEEYLLGLTDATFAFIGAASLKLSRSYSRIKLDPSHPATSSRLIPLSVHTPTSTLILPSSHPSSLQIYSPTSATLVSELEVSPSNRVSRRDEKLIEPCRVEQVTVSPDGTWMASVDRREGDEDTHAESYLKIWSWDRKTGFWILNTRIDRPHGLERVNSLTFSPVGDHQPQLLATAGADGVVKTWRTHTARRTVDGQEEFWVARSAYTIHDQIPSNVSWSPDGSLLAATTRHQITLFSSATNQLLRVLAYPECSQFNSVHFLGKGGRYAVLIGGREVLMWDLVMLRVKWHEKYDKNIFTVVPHPRENNFAIVLHPIDLGKASSEVAIVQVETPQPVRTVVLPFRLTNVTWYPLLSAFSLVGITHDWRVVVVGDMAQLPQSNSHAPMELKTTAIPQRRTLFEDIFGKSAFSDNVTAASSSSPAPSWTAGATPFDLFSSAPTYMMPSLETLFEPIMASQLQARDLTHLDSAASEADEESEEMDVDNTAILSSVPEHRRVDQNELDLLVNLFQSYSLKGQTSAPSVGTGKQNGIVNGSGLTNGIHVVVPPSKVNGTPFKSAVPEQVSETLTPPMTVGRKRKKSMV